MFNEQIEEHAERGDPIMAKSLEDTVPPEVFAAASYIRDWFPESAVFIGGFSLTSSPA
jgi:hypothetical protein